MAATNNNINQQVYNAREDDSLLNDVAQVICILVQRALVIAAYDSSGTLLTSHYTDYKNNLPVWGLDFFEHQFINEPLLRDQSKVKAVFLGGDKQLIVPDELHDKTLSVDWLKKIHFVDATDVVNTWPLTDDKAQYILASPVSIVELVKIYFKRAKVQPLAIYQFADAPVDDAQINCCITNEHVYATFYNNKQLLWHQCFDYTTAEDIAYHLKLRCKESGMDAWNVMLHCTALSATAFDAVNGLSQYFSRFTIGTASVTDYRWAPAVSLLQQLYTCA